MLTICWFLLILVIGLSLGVVGIINYLMHMQSKISNIGRTVAAIEFALEKIDAEVTCIANHYLLKDKGVE